MIFPAEPRKWRDPAGTGAPVPAGPAQQTFTDALPEILHVELSAHGDSRTDVLFTVSVMFVSRVLANSVRAAMRTSPPPLTVPPWIVTL